MNQCVPSWDLDDNSKIKFQNHSNSLQDVPSLDYEVAELTWENGQLAMHGLGVPRVANKPPPWQKPLGGGTLESIVNQATFHLPPSPPAAADNSKELVPWFEHHRAMANAAAAGGGGSLTVTMDSLVPCNNRDQSVHVPAMGGSRLGCSTRVGSCSGAADGGHRVVRPGTNGCRTNGRVSMSESATCGWRDSRTQMTIDTWERELAGPNFMSSPENTISGQDYTKTSADDVDRDSISHRSRSHASDRKAHGEEGKRRDNGRSSVSTKRSRAAAIHNQSERKRRDKINQRMKTLQKMVPNSSKADKASMLDEVIDYLKQLQAQVHVINRMNFPSMMLPLAMQQQQLQMSMMGIGMGMGMGVMDINSITRPASVPLAPFMPVPAATWDNQGECLPAPPPAAGSVMPDPLAALLACQSQPMTMDAYSRLAAIYQQLQQQPGSKS